MGQFCLSDIVPYHVPILLKTANGISCKSISPKFEKSIRSFGPMLLLFSFASSAFPMLNCVVFLLPYKNLSILQATLEP